jgi:hypothetical protein
MRLSLRIPALKKLCWHVRLARKAYVLFFGFLDLEFTMSQDVLSRHPSTESTRLQLSLQKFSLWLSRPELVHTPRLSGLAAQRLHTQILQAALGRLAQAYETVCVEVRRPENRYEAGSTLLGSERPFGQVHLLWQIFGLADEGLELG